MDDVRQTEQRMILGRPGPDPGCDACFDQLDRYVEAQLAGADADAVAPGLATHLEGCPACREEHASLLALARRHAVEREPRG
jgi:anti-sigma factor RsiW